MSEFGSLTFKSGTVPIVTLFTRYINAVFVRDPVFNYFYTSELGSVTLSS